MTTISPATTATDILAAARGLAGELSARAAEAEAAGTLPPDLVARARDLGLFRMLQPRALGGLELDPASVVRVVEELARADGSAGWTLMIGNGAPGFSAWLEPHVALELFGPNADFTAACVFAPTGRAVPGGDGYVVGGHWPFASGCRHAEWFLNGVFVFDGDAPRMIAGRGPDWRLAFFPRAHAEIIDNWDVLGLRATGSNDVAAANVMVREEHTISPFFEPARQPGPLWRLPFFTLVGVSLVGFPLGVARRALDEFVALAPTKTRAGTFEPIANDTAIQAELARAEAGLQSARAFVFDAIGALWDSASAGDVPSLDERARFQLAAQQAMRAAVDAVDRMFNATGASAVHASHPLQRCFRDIHTAKQHIYFSDAALSRYAKTRLGIEQPTFTI